MSAKVTKVLCYIFYCLLSVLIILGLGIFLYEVQLESMSCQLSDKSLIEIVNLNDTKKVSTGEQNAEQNQTTVDFTGRYRMVKSENFDKFLETLGVGYFQRTLATRVSPDYEITKDGDVYTLKTISSIRTTEITFKFGEEFEESRLDGELVKTTIHLMGNKWIQKQVGQKNTVHIVREFRGDTIIVTGNVGDVKFVRNYERVKE